MRDTSIEQGRQIRRAQRLASAELYGKAAKTLAQRPAVDAPSDSTQAKTGALHPEPVSPVIAIPTRDLPPKTVIDRANVLAVLLAIGKDSRPGPDRVGVRWLLLVTRNKLRAGPDHSGLHLL